MRRCFLFFGVLFFPFFVQASPFYAGILGGYGSTTWGSLINKDSTTSTPTDVDEGGLTYGVFAGYEFTPLFALEGEFIRFPHAHISFDPYSDYAFNDNVTEMDSRTWAYSFSGKFMVPIKQTGLRAFASAGVALIERRDLLAQTHSKVGGTFGVGVNYNLTKHLMSELAFQYYTGYGKSQDDPVYHYVPFLYTVNLKLGYRF